MTTTSSHRYVAEVINARGEHVADVRLSPDFGAGAECAYFEGIRQDRLPARMRHGPAHVSPVFDPQQGEPYVHALRFTFDAQGAQAFSRSIPRTYLSSAVEAAATPLVSEGRLRAGETFTYRPKAFPDNSQDCGTVTSVGFTIEEAPLPLETVVGNLQEFLDQGECRGPHIDGDMPVFVDMRILDDTIARAREAGRLEVGGMLIGHLRRDATRAELFAEVTAQIPARHTVAGETRLTFTPETWAAARAAIELRKRGENLLGWWHSHPYFCADCPPERQRVCAYSCPFFSIDDRALHAAVFGRAFDLALLLTDTGAGELSVELFGWRDGSIAARAFHAIRSTPTNTQTGAGRPHKETSTQ